MKFILLSRHTDGSEIPESEMEQNMKDMGAWITLLKATVAMPIRGGKSLTAKKVEEYDGDAGGLIIFEAENLHQAVGLVRNRQV